MLLFIQPETLTPYVLALLTLVVGVQAWMIKRSIAHGEELATIRTSLKIYLEMKGAGAAMVLDSPNPTPPEIRDLLRKYQRGELGRPEEYNQLISYLTTLKDARDASKSEKSAAYDLLSAMEGLENMKKKPCSFWSWFK